MITKAARYGIKMYVATDAVDEYVLRTSMYTGDDQGIISKDDTLKKTTNVVLDLVQPYFNTYRSVKTDRYYKSIELAKELAKKKLYNTGTLMANRIAKELRWIAKVSRKKERGEFDHHLYQYKDDSGKIENIGLVIWKDRKPVYVLTSECSTVEVDVCIRRSKQGLLHIDQPISVAQYTKYIGGVDVSDQKRPHHPCIYCMVPQK